MRVQKQRLLQIISEELSKFKNEGLMNSPLQGGGAVADTARKSDWNPGNLEGDFETKVRNIHAHWQGDMINSDEAMQFIEQILGFGPKDREYPVPASGPDVGAHTMEME
tara:strand:+ start:1291 stop:1617 length:327 start_codon:yes stop_codon:yes gene_type:complete